MNTDYNRNNISPEHKFIMMLGILQILCITSCKILPVIFGILTVVFEVKSNNYFKYNDIENFKNNRIIAKTLNSTGWIVLVINIFGGTIVDILNAISRHNAGGILY